MVRLPQPGSDEGTWGDILNEYLSAAHNNDGSLKPEAVTADTIQDNSVSPAKLSAANAPVSGRVLSYDGTNFSWAASSTTDHGALTGLGDDDHPQYHTDTRGDTRYYTKAQVDTSLGTKANDNAVVHTTGNETVAGDKEFENNLVVNGVAGIGTGPAAPAAKLEVNSGTVDVSGVRLTRLTSASSTTTANGKALSVDVEGDVILVDQPSTGDPTMGGDLSGTASNAQLVNDVVDDAKVSATANIAQSKIANLTTDLAAKASDSSVVHNNAANIVTLPDSATQFIRVNIPDDASPSSGWPDRYVNYFDGTRTGYFNEYGEIRARPAKQNTVPLRAMAYSTGSTGDVFQVTSSNLSTVYFGVSETAASLSVPLTSTANVTAPNIGAKVIVLADGEPVPGGTPVGTIILRSS